MLPFYAQIYPHGSTDTLPFATMGSGSLAAMSVFEAKYKEGLTVSSRRNIHLSVSRCVSFCLLIDFIVTISFRGMKESSWSLKPYAREYSTTWVVVATWTSA